jgi:branched-chain amino acid transport system substrate-binding protein
MPSAGITGTCILVLSSAEYAYRHPVQKGGKTMTTKRNMLVGLSVAGLIFASGRAFAGGPYGPGVNDAEIKIGQTMHYSGPASAWGTVGKAEAAYFRSVNDKGGVNGRKINLISLDDGYSPPKTLEQTR